MNFFFRKKDERKEDEDKPRKQINLSGRAYNEYQDRDASIKLWLPVSIKKKLDEVCAYIDTSASDFIRQILFVHMYGRGDFLGLVQMKHPTVSKHIESGVRFSIAPGKATTKPAAPEKNDADFKVWVPIKMKADLDRMAIQNKTSLSDYARHAIITHLLGNLPYDSRAFKELPPVGIDEG